MNSLLIRAKPNMISGFLACAAIFLVGWITAPNQSYGQKVLGATSDLGNGSVSTFAKFRADGAPAVLGVIFSASALEGLSDYPSDEHHCFDRDEDGSIVRPDECIPTHEMVLPMPDEVARHSEIPFKWLLLNWNPAGHIPPGIYDSPHFDVHFMIEPIENIFAIESGPCGPEFVRCSDFERAKIPVPAEYMHTDFQDVDAVVPAMGNHLIDLTASEFQGEPFSRTWIFGSFDGRVTFYEEMLTLDFMLSRPDTCFPIKSPPDVAESGYYPSMSCTRFDPDSDEYTVSMEEFELRVAGSS